MGCAEKISSKYQVQQLALVQYRKQLTKKPLERFSMVNSTSCHFLSGSRLALAKTDLASEVYKPIDLIKEYSIMYYLMFKKISTLP